MFVLFIVTVRQFFSAIFDAVISPSDSLLAPLMTPILANLKIAVLRVKWDKTNARGHFSGQV
jgi:hypothetical protein